MRSEQLSCTGLLIEMLIQLKFFELKIYLLHFLLLVLVLFHEQKTCLDFAKPVNRFFFTRYFYTHL